VQARGDPRGEAAEVAAAARHQDPLRPLADLPGREVPEGTPQAGVAQSAEYPPGAARALLGGDRQVGDGRIGQRVLEGGERAVGLRDEPLPGVLVVGVDEEDVGRPLDRALGTQLPQLDLEAALAKRLGQRRAAREVAEADAGARVGDEERAWRSRPGAAQSISQVRTSSCSTATRSGRPTTFARSRGATPKPGRLLVSISSLSTVPAG